MIKKKKKKVGKVEAEAQGSRFFALVHISISFSIGTRPHNVFV